MHHLPLSPLLQPLMQMALLGALVPQVLVLVALPHPSTTTPRYWPNRCRPFKTVEGEGTLGLTPNPTPSSPIPVAILGPAIRGSPPANILHAAPWVPVHPTLSGLMVQIQLLPVLLCVDCCVLSSLAGWVAATPMLLLPSSCVLLVAVHNSCRRRNTLTHSLKATWCTPAHCGTHCTNANSLALALQLVRGAVKVRKTTCCLVHEAL
jgi:hypothetical protein